MKIAIVNNNYTHTKQAVKQLKEKLDMHHFVSSNPDVVIAVGGDGTFLQAFQKYWAINPNVKFVAIHSGLLGFYSDFKCSEINQFVKAFNDQQYIIQTSNVLEIQEKDFSKKFYALNDFRVESISQTCILDIKINGKFLEKFRGNGISFSTTTGSTAYNKSLGGAIIWPSLEAFQMTEVAGISNNAYTSLGSSIIFSNSDKIEVYGNFLEAFITYDTNFKIIKGKKSYNIKIAQDKIKIIHFDQHYNFHQRIKDAFIK